MNEHLRTQLDQVIAKYDGDVTNWEAQNEIGKLIVAFRHDVQQHQFEQVFIAALSTHLAEKRNHAAADHRSGDYGTDVRTD